MSPPSHAAAAKGKGKGKGKGKCKGAGSGKAQAKEMPNPGSGRACELCREDLPEAGAADASFQKVPLTVSCYSCAEGFRSHEGMLLACQSRAMQEFKISHDDLAVLKYTTKTNPHSWRNPLKLFVRAECEVGVHARRWLCLFLRGL